MSPLSTEAVVGCVRYSGGVAGGRGSPAAWGVSPLSTDCRGIKLLPDREGGWAKQCAAGSLRAAAHNSHAFDQLVYDRQQFSDY